MATGPETRLVNRMRLAIHDVHPDAWVIKTRCGYTDRMTAVSGCAKKGAPRTWLREVVRSRPRTKECWTDWPWAATRGVHGYPVATDEHGRQRPASHLVLELDGRFRPDPNSVAMHSCDNPPCVNPRHLSWGTQKQNIEDMRAKGRARGHGVRGEENTSARLTEDAVREIRARVEAGELRKDLAIEFGVSKATVGLAVMRRTWAHVE